MRLYYDASFYPLPWIIQRRFLWVFWTTWATCSNENRAKYLIKSKLKNN